MFLYIFFESWRVIGKQVYYQVKSSYYNAKQASIIKLTPAITTQIKHTLHVAY